MAESIIEPVIEIEHLTLGYKNCRIINDINAQINAGEIIGIIGPNGAGKSTFLKTLRNLMPCLTGKVKFFGKDNTELSAKDFARIVAYLQQNTAPSFGYTAREIVLTGRYPYMKWWQEESDFDKQIADECMKYTGTLELAERSVNEVSGGQRQRILLAKVLAQQTPILFLDEPTTGLDVIYQEEFFRFAAELSKFGKTVLMVVHELNFAAKYCSRIFLIANGELLADGKPKEVFTEELLSRAYKTNVQVSYNPLNGNMEITTVQDYNKTFARNELLKRICLTDVEI